MWIGSKSNHTNCPYCNRDNNDFAQLNTTFDYSGLEIALNRQGMLRLRCYADDDTQEFFTQDVVLIKYCPYCGRKMR